MTINVHIDLYSPEDKEAFAAFLTASAIADRKRPKDDYAGSVLGISRDANAHWRNHVGGETEPQPPVDNEPADDVTKPEEAATNAPKRERGKASAGRARRTKEEIAEDEAADAADAAELAAMTASNISTGENRIDPANPEPEDDAATQAQDKADEQAEVAATSTGKLTHDDVRTVLGKYVEAYGMGAAQEDAPKLLKLMEKNPAFGEGFWDDKEAKISAIPDTQEALRAAIAGFTEMLNKNPYNRKANL